MDGNSLDLKQDKIEKLKAAIPEAFTEGLIDWEKLKGKLLTASSLLKKQNRIWDSKYLNFNPQILKSGKETILKTASSLKNRCSFILIP